MGDSRGPGGIAASVRNRLRNLQRQAEEELLVIELADGTVARFRVE